MFLTAKKYDTYNSLRRPASRAARSLINISYTGAGCWHRLWHLTVLPRKRKSRAMLLGEFLISFLRKHPDGQWTIECAVLSCHRLSLPHFSLSIFCELWHKLTLHDWKFEQFQFWKMTTIVVQAGQSSQAVLVRLGWKASLLPALRLANCDAKNVS